MPHLHILFFLIIGSVTTIAPIASPYGLACDASGKVWATTVGGHTVSEFPGGVPITGLANTGGLAFVWLPNHDHTLIFSSSDENNNCAGLFVWNGGKRYQVITRARDDLDVSIYTITALDRRGSKVYYSYYYDQTVAGSTRGYLSNFVLDTHTLRSRRLTRDAIVKLR